jgi:hypothetical protein
MTVKCCLTTLKSIIIVLVAFVKSYYAIYLYSGLKTVWKGTFFSEGLRYSIACNVKTKTPDLAFLLIFCG